MTILNDIKTRHQRCESATGSALPSNVDGDGSAFGATVPAVLCLSYCIDLSKTGKRNHAYFSIVAVHVYSEAERVEQDATPD
jgi:hypothetical protein